MDSPNILVVEDDPSLGEILSEYLNLKNFRTTLSADGESALQNYYSRSFDLILLDIMLPKKDGFTVAREIRKNDPEIPIIFLTAKTLKEDTIEGFRIGADDYITKPFSMEELILRIQAVLRRVPGKSNRDVETYHLGKFIFDSVNQTLTRESQSIRLTTKESRLLKLLCEHKNAVLNRRVALRKIWGDDSYFNARSMDVYVTRLRKYLREDENLNLLTVHGEGLKLIDRSAQ